MTTLPRVFEVTDAPDDVVDVVLPLRLDQECPVWTDTVWFELTG